MMKLQMTGVFKEEEEVASKILYLRKPPPNF